MNQHTPGPLTVQRGATSYEADLQLTAPFKDNPKHRFIVARANRYAASFQDKKDAVNARLLAAAYNAFDKAGRELDIDAAALAEQTDIAALLKERAAMREALEACRVFITPLEHLKGWNDYKEDAAQCICAIVGGVV